MCTFEFFFHNIFICIFITVTFGTSIHFVIEKIQLLKKKVRYYFPRFTIYRSRKLTVSKRYQCRPRLNFKANSYDVNKQRFYQFFVANIFFAHSATMPKFSTQICYCARFNFHCYNPSVRAQHRTKKSSPMPSACIVRFHLLIDYFCQSYHFIYALCLFAASSHLIFVSGSFSPLSSGWSEKSNEFFILCVCMSVFFLCARSRRSMLDFADYFKMLWLTTVTFVFSFFFLIILVFPCAGGWAGVRFSRHLDFQIPYPIGSASCLSLGFFCVKF